MKGKGSALGVGRGRAVAMRSRVSYLSHFIYAIFINTINTSFRHVFENMIEAVGLGS